LLLGLLEGFELGLIDGLDEGLLLGLLDGLDEGLVLGLLDGLDEVLLLGLLEGFELGLLNGSDEGGWSSPHCCPLVCSAKNTRSYDTLILFRTSTFFSHFSSFSHRLSFPLFLFANPA